MTSMKTIQSKQETNSSSQSSPLLHPEYIRSATPYVVEIPSSPSPTASEPLSKTSAAGIIYEQVRSAPDAHFTSANRFALVPQHTFADVDTDVQRAERSTEKPRQQRVKQHTTTVRHHVHRRQRRVRQVRPAIMQSQKRSTEAGPEVKGGGHNLLPSVILYLRYR